MTSLFNHKHKIKLFKLMADNYSNNRKKKAESVDYFVHGKIPPQALEVEEAVLGSMLLEKDSFLTVSEFLKAECFYKDAHQKIFEAITNLFSRQMPADIITVSNELKRLGILDEVGGAYYLTELTGKVASAANLEYHARIIYQKFLQRKMIEISGMIVTKAYDETEDVDDLLEEAESSLFLLSQGTMKNEAVQINPVVDEALELIKLAGERKDGLSGVPSGFDDLDKITSGWQNSDMVVIAARPAMGKTAFVLSMARNMAINHNQGVAVFSLEMSNVQLVTRLIVAETEFSSDKIKNGNLTTDEWDILHSKIQTFSEAPIFVDDTAGLSVFDLRAKCRRLKKQHDIKVVIIDYLQLMNASGMRPGNRQEEVSMISRSLKGLAKELNIPIIALSQLNRSVETRSGDGKKPQLSDLRESGAIEQDADMVLFIHRPEYYGITEDSEGNSLLGLAEIIIAKHRNGATGDVRLRFRPEAIKFENISESQMYSQPNYGGMNVLSSSMNKSSDMLDNTSFGQGGSSFKERSADF